MNVTDPTFAEDLLAELAVLNAGVITVLRLAAMGAPDPDAFCAAIQAAGHQGLRHGNYYSIPPERRDAFLANVEARWDDLITSVLK